MTVTKICREEEAKLPSFTSHVEAREYFKQQYGDAFIKGDSEVIEGKEKFFYRLILEPKAFREGMRELHTKGYTQGLDFINSYQSIEIFEDGTIHIIHL